MVGKKSGKALLREEGLERTDNNMDLTSWPQVQAINQKNYYVEFLKRDEQLLAVRMQQEEARSKMIKQARDRDRALAQGKQVGPDGDIEMDDDQDNEGEEEEEEEEDELATGSKTVVLHLGSQNLRIGLANDALPKTVPMVIARRSTTNESEEDGGEPAPKRRKRADGTVEPVPEKRFGEEFASKFVAMSNELKTRMRMNKRKVLPQSRDMVTSYNKRTMYETITEHNDTLRIDWTDVFDKPEYVTGKAALRIPDRSEPRYKLYWPLRHGWINEVDYTSVRAVYNDIRLIVEDTVRKELKLDLGVRRDWNQYSCVIVIPDYYERTYVTSLLELALQDIGFARVCFIQESLAASFGAGFTTCCIVDIGAQKTSICCVEDGMVVDNSRVNLKYGGHDVTDTFVKMIIYNHFPYAEVNLKHRYDFLLVEELKQKFSTMVEADISVQLYDFHLRTPAQDTRKYTFKTYDEVTLAPTGFFKPGIFDHGNKLTGRRRLVDMSHDLYDGKPNDPTSSAQAEILSAIAPIEIVNATTKSKPLTNGTLNGINPHIRDELMNSGGGGGVDSRRTSVARVQDLDAAATPGRSNASSPVRKFEATPQPDIPTNNNNIHPSSTTLDSSLNGAGVGTPPPSTGLNAGGNSDDVLAAAMLAMSKPPYPLPDAPEEDPEPPIIERRDDILPVQGLASAVTTSINHAARGSPQKTRDFLGSLLLIGGASKTAGMGQYLEDTLQGVLPGYAKDILVGRPPRELDPEVVVWKGGAVFGRMSRTNDSWVTPFLYERLGERVLAHKLMWAW